MDDKPRSERRRLARSRTALAASPLFRRRDVLAVAAIAAGIVGTVAGITLLSSGSDDSASVGASLTTPPATLSAGPAFVPSNPDEVAIEALARRSIEVLPAGQWPSLYDDFTPEFQQRCPRQEFADGGARNAIELGSDLPLLGFKRLDQVSLAGDKASAVVYGEIRGKSEYSVEAAFQRIDGTWKLAPASNTAGCAAFNRLGG